MPAIVRFNTDRVNEIVEQQLLPAVARLKVQDLLEASWDNFRDRTGQLRATIRIHITPMDVAVAIGTQVAYYWQYVRGLTRGDGRIWILEALRWNLSERYREAAIGLGLT